MEADLPVHVLHNWRPSSPLTGLLHIASGWGVWWELWQMAALTLELGIWNLSFDVERGLWQGPFRCDMAGHGLCVGLYKAG